jgi:hypothetical protein
LEDQHGSLLHGEATDPAVELVSIDDRMESSGAKLDSVGRARMFAA